MDVLHTNPGVFGFLRPIGDVDFYANPGSWIQPGCWVDELIKNREFRFVCKYVICLHFYLMYVLLGIFRNFFTLGKLENRKPLAFVDCHM